MATAAFEAGNRETFPLMGTHICVLVVAPAADGILIFWMPDVEANALFSSHLSFLTRIHFQMLQKSSSFPSELFSAPGVIGCDPSSAGHCKKPAADLGLGRGGLTCGGASPLTQSGPDEQMAAGRMMDTLRGRRGEDGMIDVEVTRTRYQTVLFSV